MELSARSAYRGQVTKIVKSATEFPSSKDSQLTNEDKFDNIEEELLSYVQRLTAAHESLKTTNEEIICKNLLKGEDMDKELDKIADYEDQVINTLARLNFRLGKIRQKQKNVNNAPTNNTTSMNCPNKLPTLPLKKFDGSFHEWLPLWEQFRTTVHENANLAPTDKFSYLESLLVGSAKKVIAGFTASEMCYDAAISLLQEQYGDKERLVDKQMQQLISLRPIHTKTDVAGLRSLYNSIMSCSRTLTSLQVPPQQYCVMLKSILLRCLPTDLRVDYYRTLDGDDDITNVSNSEDSVTTLTNSGDKQVQNIMRFLKREVESLERSKVVSLSSSHAKTNPLSTAISLFSPSDKDHCLFCTSTKHLTRECDSNNSIAEKREILRKNGCCYRCSKRGHSSKKCRSAKFICCKKCKGKHMTSMCDPFFKKATTSAYQTAANTSGNNITENVCMYNSSFQYTNVFLKTARGIVVSPNKKHQILIRFIIDGGSQYSYVRESLVNQLDFVEEKKVFIAVIPFGSKEKCPPREFRKVKISIKSQFTDKSLALEAVVVPDICVDVLCTPDVSCPEFHGLQLADSQQVEIESMDGLTVLIGSDFYWSAVTGRQRRLSSRLRAVETIFGWTLQGPHTLSGKKFDLVSNLQISSVVSTNLMLPAMPYNDGEFLWSLEAIGIRNEEVENKHQTEDLINKCITKKNIRYEASLPWKTASSLLSNNRSDAVKRLNALTRRLLRVPGRFEEYNTAMRQLISDGVAEAVPGGNHSNRLFYPPHRPVYKSESTTTKLRIVFDASARSEEFGSLNDQLNIGANLLPDIFKVLLNFRLGRFGIVADVEKAFLQIWLNEADRDSHRFVWFGSDGNFKEYKDFRMTRVTFGINCSPFLLTATLKLHLKQEEIHFGRTCDLLRDSFYMDDLVMSVDTEEEGERISKEAVLILRNASMNLRKFNSNSQRIRSSLSSDNTPVNQKVLGLTWLTLTDELAVSLQSVEQLISSNVIRNTKRNVLQSIARIFDPLGMLGPVVIRVKILFQRIWKEKLQRDEPLNSSLNIEWEACLQSILQLKAITIPRSAFGLFSPESNDIHIFADASLKAYGTVAYLKNKGETGENNIAFLCAKSRVAPLKQDDSKIALSWIQGKSNRWKPFVQSRVDEIRRHTSLLDWHHCSGKDNPADFLTRGVSSEILLTSDLWAHGPEWLKGEVSYQKDNMQFSFDTAAQLALLTPVPLMIRVTCFVLRFWHLCKKVHVPSLKHLSVDDLLEAKTYWIRYIQRSMFNHELSLLQKGQNIPPVSRIAQLLPFLGKDGIMRLRGRFHATDESDDFKHPVLLPGKHVIVDLIVDDCRQVVKRRLRKCVVCQKLWAKPSSQPFGPLPIEWITISRPFDNVGVDFAGPLYYFNSKGESNKAYMMVFTCASVRAIHIELVTNLSTESCLLGLRRFICRRGAPSTVFSDNARTFRRAALELNAAEFSCDDEAVHRFLADKKIRWKFIVERAPWWGGFWERLIRNIKNILKVVIGRSKLSFEQLRTLVIEAEGMINARPLTYISSDPLDDAPLTPADFLVGRFKFSNGSIGSSQAVEIRDTWKQRMKYTNMLWKRWRCEYMQLLRSFHYSKPGAAKEIKRDDVVLVFDSAKPRIHWRLAVIEEAFIGRDGNVRACAIRYADGTRTRRPIQLLYPLELHHPARPEDVEKTK